MLRNMVISFQDQGFLFSQSRGPHGRGTYARAEGVPRRHAVDNGSRFCSFTCFYHSHGRVIGVGAMPPTWVRYLTPSEADLYPTDGKHMLRVARASIHSNAR